MVNQYKKITLNDCKDFAKNKDGKCLSVNYVNANSKLKWECKFEHKFELAWKHIQYYQSWCPQCSSNIGEEICRAYLNTIFDAKFISVRPDWLKYLKYNLQLDGYCKELNIAFEHNGLQHNTPHQFFHKNENDLSKQITRDSFKLDKCNEFGVKLIIIPEIFREIKLCDLKNHIINECIRLQITIPKDISNVNFDLSKIHGINNKLEFYKNLAMQNGGECLSNNYVHYHEPLIWKCNKDHIWKACGFSIEYGTWCPDCYGHKKLSIEDAHFIASKNGGICLSDIYTNAHTKLKWECAEGHVWEATMASVRNIGSWCMTCSSKRKGRNK